jgi:predicted amidophosphoribosyltransferase
MCFRPGGVNKVQVCPKCGKKLAMLGGVKQKICPFCKTPLTEDPFAQLKAEDIKGMKPEHAAAAKPEHIKGMKAEHLAALRPELIKAMKPEVVKALREHPELEHLSPEAKEALDAMK